MSSHQAPADALETFSEKESNVQSYGRSFPVVFDRAEGVSVHDTSGRAYLDFLAGAGSLNYGHNHPVLRDALLAYIGRGGITHSLDMHTEAKRRFLESLNAKVLEPRGLAYRVQFPGPTGANAVEAAMKLARKVTGRETIVAFTNGFHGVSLGALAATGNSHHRGAAGTTLGGVARMPYAGYVDELDSLAFLEKCLEDASSGIDHPAAVLVETVQGEGGLNAASFDWLRRLEAVCRRHEILLVVDDIQAGCGRTGTFFSFEPAGITPDIVVLSKSLSGFGLPLSIVLIRPDLDEWAPGEHNGTFRGNNHAFVTAAAAIEHFWSDDAFAEQVREKARVLEQGLDAIVSRHPDGVLKRKGRGLMQGIELPDGETAAAVTSRAFEQGMIIETSGPADEVVKCLCPLIISRADLSRGVRILSEAVDAVVGGGEQAAQSDAAD